MKIGDKYTYTYKSAERQFKIGQYVKVDNVQFVVEETDDLQATGKIINTYRHKRRKNDR